MNAQTVPSPDDTRLAALARILTPIDKARAVFRGLVVVGHRRSVEAGEMYWALPGGQFAHGARLASLDPTFAVVDEPSTHYLREQQPILAALTQ